MVTSKEALSIVLQNPFKPVTEKIAFRDSRGRVLAVHAVAPYDIPPYDRVTMDGIAVRLDDLQKGQRRFPVQCIQRAGDPPVFIDPGKCVEIMTGSVCSGGADVIIPYEQTRSDGNDILVNTENFMHWQNVHRQGTDRKKGEAALNKGSKLGAVELGVLASFGMYEPEVLTLPKVKIYSTGNELVDVSEIPLPHQLRKSNVFVIEVMITEMGLRCETDHLDDDPDQIRSKVKHDLDNFDVLILSGGVSKGKFDLLPEVFRECGVKELFHGVAQRPGKPFWFGRFGSTVIFAFPGNPVSTVVCACVYFKAWLNQSMGFNSSPTQAKLTKNMAFKAGLTHFVQCNVFSSENGTLQASPVVAHGSGDYLSLVGTAGFIELPDTGEAQAGNFYPLHLL